MQGFVVQNDVLQVDKDCGYRGIFRYRSWPTAHISNVYSSQPGYDMAGNNIFDFMEKYLDRKYDETGAFLCDDDRLAAKYAKALRDCGDTVRVLLVQTFDDFDSGIPDGVFSAFDFLGYDVIYHNGFYSAVADDLYINVPEPMQGYSERLDSGGIFGEYSDAAEFLSDIDRCAQMGYDIEPAYGFDIVKLYEAVHMNL